MIKRLVFLLLLLALSTTVHAQRFNKKQIVDGMRHHQWEATMLVAAESGIDASFEGGSALNIDDSIGWGFSIGWNWTSKWHLSYKFMLNKPDYQATFVPEDPDEPTRTLDYSMAKYTSQFNATYHFFEGPLTPFVQAGVGWTKLDSNVPSQPPSTGCWWDPWWGWICSTTWKTYETSEFSYNAGLGLRWDVNGALFLRGTYSREWISLDNGSMDFDTLSLEAGMMW